MEIKARLVDYYASWCRPCQELTPVLERLEEQFAGKVDFVKVDVSDRECWEEYHLWAVPTIAIEVETPLFQGEVARLVGVTPDEEEFLKLWINRCLPQSPEEGK